MNTDMVTRESLGHLFGDWSDGIDYERCGHCGLYSNAFESTPNPCPIGGSAGMPKPKSREWGRVWAVHPHLTPSDVFNSSECPDAMLFESRENTLRWLGEPSGPHGESRRNQRCYSRIAVRSLSEFEGAPYEGPTFYDFLTTGLPLDPWPSINFETAVLRSLNETDPPISAKLAPDWDFEAIVRESQFGLGHEFQGRRLNSFPDQIGRAINDLQQSFGIRHPQAPAEAEACFLESWDVLRHIAEFCGKCLCVSAEADRLIERNGLDRWRKENYIWMAREAVHVQVAVYSAQMRNPGAIVFRVSELNASPFTSLVSAPEMPLTVPILSELNESRPPIFLRGPDPFSTRSDRNKAILDFMAALKLPSRQAAANKLRVHYQDLNKWKLYRELAKHHSTKQDRIERGLLTRPTES